MQIYFVLQQSPHMFGGNCMKTYGEGVARMPHVSFPETRGSWSHTASFARPLLPDKSQFRWPSTEPAAVPICSPLNVRMLKSKEWEGGRCVLKATGREGGRFIPCKMCFGGF